MVRVILLTLLLSVGVCLSLQAKDEISYTVNADGRIAQILVPSNGQIVGGEINFRNDEFAGPSLWMNNAPLSSSPLVKGTVKGSMGKNDTLSYQIVYRTEGKRLAIDITCSNLLKQKLEDVQLSCRLGIDTEMERFPHWRSVFFPTLMRCEQSSFWGYLMTPMGRILTVTCPNPIASYHLHYNNSRHKISFSNGHRIRTVSLDLLNPDPLPQRHPQGLVLAAGETRTWTIYLEEVATLSDVAAIASQNTTAPIFQADYYTLASGEKAQVSLYSSSIPHVAVVTPEGERRKVRVRKSRKNLYTFTYPMSSVGIHTFMAANSKGQSAEIKLAWRHRRYSDYIKAARLASLTYQQKTNSNAESWYGLFSGLIARAYFPDKEVDDKVDKVFHQINKLTLVSGIHLPANNPMRIQDSALKAALFAQYYRATGVLEYLRQAADIADFVMTTQLTYEWDAMLDNTEFTGAYHSEKTHYTSVIYIAKGIMEVMREEKKLIESDKTGEWQHRYDRHYASVKMAMDDLAERLDNIQTEGQMTFEDGMISCSYTQLAEFALLHSPDSPERVYYTQAAEQLANMHRCLSQIVVPDTRMNGGSLRFWESQYDILTMPNMMNSPHGWSAWRIYGLRSLYLLTGNYDYLRQMVNAIGACIQLIDPDTGKLNWAFVCDPYIVAQRFVPDEAKPYKGKHVEQVLGEQYLPMISDWYRADTTKLVSSFGRFDGGNCDNDVHEIFKCLGEVLLTSAYVYEHPDGALTTHNCVVVKDEYGWKVVPNEACVQEIHLNLRSPQSVKVKFVEKEVKQQIQNGWICNF